MRELNTLKSALDAANSTAGRALEGMERANTLFLAIERIASADNDSLLAELAREGTAMLGDYIDSTSCDAGDFDAAWRRAVAEVVA